MYIALPYPISHGHWLKHKKDHKTVCVPYWVPGNKASSIPNPNPPCSRISMPHASEKNKHRWSDDVDRFGNHWSISTVVEKAFHIFQWLLSWLLQNREKDYLLPTWVQKITCQRFDWMLWMKVGKFFSELKLVTDNLSLHLRPFM